MIGKVIIVNGQKKIQELTADTGIGAPVGSYLYLEKKSNPQGYLYCDGSTFDETVYPALYQYLGTNVLPDWREFSAVGAEQNTTSSVIATHDVFTQGQEKDDCLQDHQHENVTDYSDLAGNTKTGLIVLNNYATSIGTGVTGARKGTVTRGKSKAVFIYIKATSGLTENQQENVLNTINENNSYSTEEHPTGAKWIDGKPIYKKTLTGNVTANVTSEIDIATLNIADLPNVEGAVKTGGNIIPFGYGTSSADKVICFYNSTTGKFLVQSAYAGSFYVTIEYTKTTD